MMEGYMAESKPSNVLDVLDITRANESTGEH